MAKSAVVASRKRGAPTPQFGPDLVDSTRKRAKTVLGVPAAEVMRHQHATRVSEYQVIDCLGSASMVERLNEQVNKMMKEGWQPLGGPSSKAQRIVQAMVKYE